MDVRNLYRRKNLVFESAGFGNVIFLSKEDCEFIRNIGIYAFENFHKSCETNVREAADMSALFRMLKKESQAQLKEEKKVFWAQETYNEDDPKEGFNVGTVSERMCEGNVILTKPLREENVFLYLPVVEDWLNYYIPKSANDTVETREVIRSTLIPLEGQNRKRQVITTNHQLDLVEVVRNG